MAEYISSTEERNRLSLERQRKGRALRKAEDALEGIIERTDPGTSREFTESLEKAADLALEKARVDLDTNYNPSQNKDDFESDIMQRAIDEFLSPNSTSQSGAGSGTTNGLPEGFSEETLDVVAAGNSAVQRVFLTKTV